jgi:hypothetical protein
MLCLSFLTSWVSTKLCSLAVASLPKTGNVSWDVARTRKWESGGLEH